MFSFHQTSADAEQPADGTQEQPALNDSISIWFRKESDASLANQLMNSFNQRDNLITLFPVELAEIPRAVAASNGANNSSGESSLRNRFYFAGDHFSFWSISNKNYSSFSLPTVFLTTMGIFRFYFEFV